ncbi:MAG: transcription-repair coupling factor, partial [Bacteroidota bacterium]
MKNLQRLIQLYAEDNRVKALNAALNLTTPTRLQMVGMMGAQEAFVLTGSFLASPQTHLYIANDKEEAAYLLNTLENLFDKKPIQFFPDSFRRPQYFEVLNSTNVLQRTETVNKIASSKASGEIIITYPEALFEKVVAPEVLHAQKIDIVVDSEMDVDFIMEVLVEFGFERVDFVYEPGQFSIRGGIVDIFSYGNEY